MHATSISADTPMKKYKPILYGIYILYFVLCAVLALTYEDLVLHWKWDFIETWVGLMRFVLKLAGIGVILFGSVLIIENLHIRELKRKISDQQKKIEELESGSEDK